MVLFGFAVAVPAALAEWRLIGESKADASDRGDVSRGTGIVFQFLPEPRDVDVESLRRAKPMRVPDLIHDLLPPHYIAGVCHEHMQEVEFLGGQLDWIAIL
jgi:hypothetical protein